MDRCPVSQAAGKGTFKPAGYRLLEANSGFDGEHILGHGGEGVAYHDLVAGNAGGQYRPAEDVDIVVAGGNGTGYRVNNIQTGEWLSYTIDVEQPGPYRIEAHVSSQFTLLRQNAPPGRAGMNGKESPPKLQRRRAQGSGEFRHLYEEAPLGSAGSFTTSRFDLEIDGVDRTDPISVPNTGHWTAFQWIGVGGVDLSEGIPLLRIHAEEEYFDLDAMRMLPE